MSKGQHCSMEEDLCNDDKSTKYSYTEMPSLWELIENDVKDKKSIQGRKKLNKCTQCEHDSNNILCPSETHLRSPSGKNSQTSNHCDSMSSRAATLRTHLKIHNGEKSNKCNQCSFASAYTYSLRRHLKTHSGEKPNKCKQCDYASSLICNLRTHLKTHSGEKSNKPM